MPGVWHNAWSACFERREVSSGTGRRVDAVSRSGKHLEFQHSAIARSEVNARQRDWALAGVELVWVVNGGEGRVGVRHLPHCDTFLLTFHTKWLVDSFVGYSAVYVHVDKINMVFCVCPADVKSGMVDVRQGLTRDVFVNWVSGEWDADPWDHRPIITSTLYYNQRGAGCGKTYESVRLITSDPRFAHKTQFLYVTKMHSSKDVIYAEYQAQTGDLRISNVRQRHTMKQYVSLFYRDDQPEIECSAVFGTIDSLFSALNTETLFSRDVFMARVRMLREQGVEGGVIQYAGMSVRLNRELLIIVDETQDLDKEYVEALTVVMRDTNADVYLIGDKLQSILTSDNAYTFLTNAELPHTVMEKSTAVNIVRRFHNPSLAAFVNRMVPFDKYGLPMVSGICSGGCAHEASHGANIAVHWVAQPTHIADIYDFVTRTMTRVEGVIKRCVYLPHHLMFIEPLVKQSLTACMLHSELEALWVRLFQDVDYLACVKLKYPDFSPTSEQRWVVWHKSETNEPINLSQSVRATRIVSIYAAKGDGRECVFVLNLMDQTLGFLNTGESPGLQFESLLHVALTRAKEQLFVFTSTVHDIVYARMDAAMKCLRGVDTHPEDAELFTSQFWVSDTVNPVKRALASDNEFQQTMDTFGLQETCERLNSQVPKQPAELVDYEYHMMRYAALDNMFMYAALSDRVGKRWMQLEVCLNEFAKSRVEVHRSAKTFWGQLKKNWFWSTEQKTQKVVPLRAFEQAEQRLYNRVAVVAEQMLTHLQQVVHHHVLRGNFEPLCPMQALLLSYALNCLRGKREYLTTSVLDVYYVLASQEHTLRTSTHSSQFNCQCDCFWSVSLDAPRNALSSHFDALRIVNASFAKVKQLIPEDEHETLEWNRAKKVEFVGDASFKIKESVHYMGRTRSHLVVCMLAPQVNTSNTPKLVMLFHHVQHMVALTDDADMRGRQVHFVIVTLNVEGGVLCVTLPPLRLLQYRQWLADACAVHVCKYGETLFHFYCGCRQRGKQHQRSGFRQALADLQALNTPNQFDVKPWLHLMDAKVRASPVFERAQLVSQDGFIMQFCAWVRDMAAVFAGVYTGCGGDMEVEF